MEHLHDSRRAHLRGQGGRTPQQLPRGVAPGAAVAFPRGLRPYDAITSEGRLRDLLRANDDVSADLSLGCMSDRVCHVARRLLGAGYSALGVIDPHGGGLRRVMVSAADDDVAAGVNEALDHLGVISRLSAAASPIRLSGLAPAVRRFLAVPLRNSGSIYAYLYLADAEATGFTLDDMTVATAFAAAASTAISNAQLLEEAARRQRWLAASAEVIPELLALDSLSKQLQALAERARPLTEADLVTVVVPDGGRSLSIRAAAGDGAAALVERRFTAADTAAAAAIDSGGPVVVEDAALHDAYRDEVAAVAPLGPLVAVPLQASRGTRGSLLIGRRPDRDTFGVEDVELVAGFARRATAALDLSAARAEAQRVLTDDRDRVAKALNGTIIRGLFAASLTLHAVASQLGSDTTADRLLGVADDLDETIRRIRAGIFDNDEPDGRQPER